MSLGFLHIKHQGGFYDEFFGERQEVVFAKRESTFLVTSDK